MRRLFQELKRRNVIRVAIAYAVAAWLLIEVSATTFPMLRLPEWTATFVAVLLMIGFPLALIFAWAFELTPEGLKREKDVDRSQSITHSTGRKLDFVIIGAMSVALLYFAVTHDWSGRQGPVEPGEITSIVVLPLDNLMNDPQQDYFVDGMHEALIAELSQIRALKVISRTSAVRYRNSEKSVPEIARELGVDAIVEGSVLRAGNTVRVTAQLIEARSDRHLWADNFDRELSDILALHSDLAESIVSEISVAVTPEEELRIANSASVNPEVYELYLKGRYLCQRVVISAKSGRRRKWPPPSATSSRRLKEILGTHRLMQNWLCVTRIPLSSSIYRRWKSIPRLRQLRSERWRLTTGWPRHTRHSQPSTTRWTGNSSRRRKRSNGQSN
jgi:TolB-like protein